MFLPLVVFLTNSVNGSLRFTGTRRGTFALGILLLSLTFTACRRHEINTAQRLANEDRIWSLVVSGSNQASVIDEKTWNLRLTDDAGKSWRVIPSSAVGDAFACAFMLNEHLGWAVNHGGEVFNTKSGGQSWTKISELKDFMGANQIEFLDEKHGWLQDTLIIWRTQDGGATWRKTISTITPGVQGQPTGMFVIDANTVAVSGSGGQVYLTKDGGETWKIQTPLPGDRIDFDDVWFVDQKHGWLTGTQIIVGGESSRPLLLETTDGGDTWKEVIVNADVMPKAICFIGEEGWVAGVQRIVNGRSVEMRGVLLKTKDAGKHWIPVQYASDQPALTSVRFSDNTHGWLVGGNRVFRTEDRGSTWRPVLTLPQ